ncbi:c-type cytochrome [Camelimonas abortus]|uniref:C-type cytochrome n=1 Tax=Camelimonas abortus TaxID=1017184 RepID=A0ABV7LGD4_9HYPH
MTGTGTVSTGGRRHGRHGLLRMAGALVAAAAITAGAATVAVGQGDPIAERKALFKQMGAALREPGKMLKGEATFDLAAVKAALETVATSSAKLPALFPDGSDTGDTAALAKAWEDRADFNARFVNLSKDARAALASVTDAESFRTVMPKLLGQCGACHKIYRKPS